ncbi:MAG TPA: M28 family peptidase, partial [Salinarimonas sp.]|nr:M28 family peptidase [Salinarimonas sp.]
MRLPLALAAVLVPLACARADESDAVPKALKSITEEVLQTHIRFLASDDLEGRAAGFPGNERAVEYLVDQVKELGLKPAGENGYTQTFAFARDRKARNVLALIEGGDAALKAQTVVIGCHLDHVGRRGQTVGGQSPGGPEGDDIWNGADDNASGTSAVLSVARAFVTGKVRPKRTILFA